jgi:hypothetical protein
MRVAYAVPGTPGTLTEPSCSAVSEEELKVFREHERTGRVLGDDEFQKRLEKKLGRVLRRQKPGPKKLSQ